MTETHLDPMPMRATKSEPEPASGENAYIGDRRGERVTVGDRLASALLWAVGGTWLVSTLTPLSLIFRVIPSWKIDWTSKLYCRGQVFLTGAKWKAVVHPDVDPKASYMFVVNHVNHLDHTTMYNATPHFKQGLELERHFKYPFYGWFMKARGTIPVTEETAGRVTKIREGMRREVERGHSILAFPEGTRTLSGKVGPFQRGAFTMARDLGIPVVPVAVTGMYDVMRKGSLLIRPFQDVTVYVEKPVSLEGMTNRQVRKAMDEIHATISARVDAYFEEKRQLRRAGSP